jgi:hypothetical protein
VEGLTIAGFYLSNELIGETIAGNELVLPALTKSIKGGKPALYFS